ncbi:hypothetical protein CHH51_18645, partial [Terribacillus saccharophilus]
IISPIILFIGLGSLFGVQILVATNQSKKLTISILAGAITCVTLGFLLVPRYGLLATAVITTITELVVVSVQLYFVKNFISFKGIFKNLNIYFFSSLI